MSMRRLGRAIANPLRSLRSAKNLLTAAVSSNAPQPPPVPDASPAFVAVSLADGTTYDLSIEPTDRDAYHEAVSVAGTQDATWSFLINWLMSSDVFFDLGANIGTISIPAAFRCTRVHAIEMVAQNVVHLRRALERNRLSNVTIIQAAVSDTPGLVGVGGGSAWGHVVSEAIVLVPTLPIDDYVRLRGISRVDVMKIDIEGSEMRALAGAAGLIARDHPDIIVESNSLTCGANGYSYRDLLRRLRDFGYTVYRLHRTPPSAAGAGQPSQPDRLCPWPEDSVQEVVYIDYLATTKDPASVEKRSGWKIAAMTDAETVAGVLSAALYDRYWRMHVLAVAGRLPKTVAGNSGVKEALREWAPLASDASFDALRIGTL